jgi:glycosyltransferase involved in cell wall biosynthesis
MIKLSLIICTYDRVELLTSCISSIIQAKENISRDLCEVLVVNNHPGSHTELLSALSQYKGIKIISEPTAGLSIARNAGTQQACGTWLGFIDDDAIVPQDFVSRAMKIISNQRFDCFGGGIESWWKYPKPRWMSDSYGSKPPLRADVGLLNTHEYNWGSNIFIRSEALAQIGGFPDYIGMKGKQIGYAAENIVQDNLRASGFVIGYDPELSILHLVGQAKLSLSWQIRAAYATARDGYATFPQDYNTSGLIKTIRRMVAAPIKGMLLLTQSEYYWENWILDSITPWAQLFGKLKARYLAIVRSS